MLDTGDIPTDGPRWTRVTVGVCTTLTAVSVVYALGTGEIATILPATFAAIWGAGAALIWRIPPVSVPMAIAAAAFAMLVLVADVVFRYS